MPDGRSPAMQALDVAAALAALSALLLDDDAALDADKRLGLGVLLGSLADRAGALAAVMLDMPRAA